MDITEDDSNRAGEQFSSRHNRIPGLSRRSRSNPMAHLEDRSATVSQTAGSDCVLRCGARDREPCSDEHVVRTESNRRRSRVVFVSNQARKPAPAMGVGSGDDHSQPSASAQSSAQTKAPSHRPKRRKSRWNAGLRMARPGLEPGTPRFSVVGRNPSNNAEKPAVLRYLDRRDHQPDVRKLRSFVADWGTRLRFGTQWVPR